MKLTLKLSLLIVLVALVIYIISPVDLFGSDTAFADEASTNGSTIGGVNVSGLDRDEMVAALTEATNQWKSEPLLITGGGAELTLDISALQFNVEASIDDFEDLTDQAWFNFWSDEKIVNLPLQIEDNSNIQSEIAAVAIWDTDATVNKIMTHASYLMSHEMEAETNDLSILENERIAFTIEEIPSDSVSIVEMAATFNNIIINPNEIFSMIGNLGELSVNTNARNFFASVLYNTVLNTSFGIVERHSQGVIPSYLEPGIEAQVSMTENKDLKFMNTTNSPAILKTAVEGNRLKVELFSSEKDSEVIVNVMTDELVAPRVINRYSNDVEIGQTQLIQEGEEGLRVSVHRTVVENGNTLETEISRDYYAPTNRIVLNSTKQPEIIEPNNSATDSDLNIDLNNDGLPDYELDEGEVPINNSNNQSPTNEEQHDTDFDPDLPVDEEDLPPGSYYDKGGNLITP